MHRVGLLLTLVVLLPAFSGCFGDDDDLAPPQVAFDTTGLVAGTFGPLILTSPTSASVFVPYLVRENASGLVHNSTVLDLSADSSVTIEVLAPPRTSIMVLLVGEVGRTNWPLRLASESWGTWLARGSPHSTGSALIRSDSGFETVFNYSADSGGPVLTLPITIHRPIHAGTAVENGGLHSTGFIHGKKVYERLSLISDTSLDPLDVADGASGFLDRWAGQGNTAYEDAALFLIQTLDDAGLRIDTHRYFFTDVFDNSNPEAYNICAYKDGVEFPNEWLVFGAHFDVAPPANLALVDPHVTGSRTYGTRVGAYDNTVGSSMVLETAIAMADVPTRRTHVFCFWSGEEGGKRGSDHWTELYVKQDHPEVTVVDYINLDMVAVNWPGGGGAPHGDPATEIDEDGYPKDGEVWPMRVYLGPSSDHRVVDQPELAGLMQWIGADALGIEEQIGLLVGSENHSAETWKVESWLEDDRPEVIIYEDTTARSDHASFQDNLGAATIGFGGLVDGYWCYHQTCDTVEEMIDWMDTTDTDTEGGAPGVQNLVDSMDYVTWYAVLTLLHCDVKPLPNELL